jgi:hypothetical protein
MTNESRAKNPPDDLTEREIYTEAEALRKGVGL